jgi:parallel beta-helix repeat protein
VHGIIIGSPATKVTISQLAAENFWSGAGIRISSGSGNIIEGCTILSNWIGIQIDSTSQGNTVRNETWINSSTNAGIYIDNSRGNEISGNTIFDNGGGGMTGIEVVNGADYNSIHHNEIYDTGFSQDVGISLSNAGDGNLVYQNEIYGHGTNGIRVYSCSPEISKNKIYDNDIGVEVDGGLGGASPNISNNLIYETVTDPFMTTGILVSVGSATASPTIHHNTIDGGGSGSQGILIDTSGTPAIKYNIVTSFIDYGINNFGNPIIDHNTIWSDSTDYTNCNTACPNTISADPVFVDPDNVDPTLRDYKLQPNSPSIDAIPLAAADTTIEQDIDGITRPQGDAYDMGCYEYAPSTTQTVPLPPGTELADFRMVSFTVQPSDPACTSVFGAEMGGSYDPDNFRIGGYNTAINDYDNCGSGLDIIPGRGYWMLARNGLDFMVDGTPASLNDTDVLLNYNATSGNGWNQIGCPNAADYLWDNVEVYERNAEGSIVQGPTIIYLLPDNNDMIDKRLWCWDNGSYFPDNVEMLQGEGYWVEARKARVYLRFRQGAQIVVAQVSNQDTMFAGLFNKAKAWVNKWVFGSEVAIANSGDLPPMPMEALSGSSAESEGGCFISTIAPGSL